MDLSITKVLKKAMNKFVLTKHFKMEKLEKLNETGLLGILTNRTVNNTFEFCSNLMMSVKRNYYTVILEKEAMQRVSSNGSVYEEAFKMLGVSNDHLKNYLIAKYTKDEKMSKKLWSQFRDSIMTTFGDTKNLNVQGNLKAVIETRFSLPSTFFVNEIKSILGFDSFVASVFASTKINSFPGYVNAKTSIKDLLMAAIPLESKLEEFFNSTVAVAATKAGIEWQTVDTIKKGESIISLISKLLKTKDSSHIVGKWLVEKGYNPKTVLLSNIKLQQYDKDDQLLPLHFLSMRIIDFYSIYNFNSPLATIIPGKIVEIGNEAYPKNLPKIFNTIPVAMVKAKFLEEDFNVDKFYNILGKYFGVENLQEMIMMKQVAYYYLTRYTGKYLNSEFAVVRTLGELRHKIVATKGRACKFLLFLKLKCDSKVLLYLT